MTTSPQITSGKLGGNAASVSELAGGELEHISLTATGPYRSGLPNGRPEVLRRGVPMAFLSLGTRV
jgi:hypothetical protein